MISVLSLLLIFFAAVTAAVPYGDYRIVGGSTTTVNQYPAIAALLRAPDLVNFRQVCGGSILNQRSILTAAHCFTMNEPRRYRVRVGSTWANSGGATRNAASIIIHPNWNQWTLDSDITIVRVASNFAFSNVVQAARIAGSNYHVADNQVVIAAGWGATNPTGGSWSEQLRHVQLRKISDAVCRQQYGSTFNNNMFCAGVPGGGQNICSGDSGGPVYHQGNVVGVVSFGSNVCGDPNRHGVMVLVSRFTSWIQSNA